MSTIQIISLQPWVERLGWALVHFLWQGLLIAALYAAVRGRTVRSSSPNARYLLGCGALLAMMACPLLTLGLLHPSAPVSASVAGGTPDVYSAAAAVSVASSGAPVPGPWSLRFLPWVVAIWIAGAVAFWIRLMGSWIVAAGLRSKQVRPAPVEWQEKIGNLGARIGLSRPVRLLVSALVQVPAVVGWLRPVVLMPIGAFAGLPREQVEALLLHELAHIRRHDYLVNILQGIMESLLFYHPAVWWVSGHIRIERELCCDDVAVEASGDVLTYARALAELESSRLAHFKPAIAASGGSLANRIGRLLGKSRQPSEPLPGPGILLSTILTVATACAVFVVLLSAFNAEAQTTAQLQARDNLNQGIRAFDKERYETAAAYFAQALKLDPSLTDAELRLADTYAHEFVPSGRVDQSREFADKAIEGFQNVLKKEPNNITAIAGLASIYQNTMDLPKAHEYYLRVEQLDPLKPVAFYAIGSLDWIIVYDRKTPHSPEEKARFIEEGLQHLDIALALDPDYEDAMTYRNLLLREKALLAPDPAEKQRLTLEADQWFNKSLETRKRNKSKATPSGPSTLAPPPPPPPPPQCPNQPCRVPAR